MQMNTMQREPRKPGRPKKETRRRKQRGGGEVIGGRLSVNKSLLDFDKYAYRWINDNPARIQAKTKEDDWDIMTNAGEKDDSPDLGAAISQIVGTNADGSPKVAYLCRKLRTYYDDDRKDAQAALDEQLSQLRRGSADGKQMSDYVPHSGIKL